MAEQADGARPIDRVLIGLLLMMISVFVLWYGSPARTGMTVADPIYAYGFLGLFALGFLVFWLGLIGGDDTFYGLLSSFVLYMIVGATVAIILYVREVGIGGWTLTDATDPAFWRHWVPVAGRWPLELIQRAGLLGY